MDAVGRLRGDALKRMAWAVLVLGFASALTTIFATDSSWNDGPPGSFHSTGLEWATARDLPPLLYAGRGTLADGLASATLLLVVAFLVARNSRRRTHVGVLAGTFIVAGGLIVAAGACLSLPGLDDARRDISNYQGFTLSAGYYAAKASSAVTIGVGAVLVLAGAFLILKTRVVGRPL